MAKLAAPRLARADASYCLSREGCWSTTEIAKSGVSVLKSYIAGQWFSGKDHSNGGYAESFSFVQSQNATRLIVLPGATQAIRWLRFSVIG